MRNVIAVFMILAILRMTDNAAQKKAYSIWGTAGRTTIMRRGNTTQTITKCVGFVSVWGEQSKIWLGKGSNWEDAFADAQANSGRIPREC